jgi:hypothetical protein
VSNCWFHKRSGYLLPLFSHLAQSMGRSVLFSVPW